MSTIKKHSILDKDECSKCSSRNTSWLIDDQHECYDCGCIY